jgi:hypothetical protein
MENFKKLVASLSETELKVSNGKINQVVRNTIKNDIVESLMDLFASFEPIRTADGVAIAVENGKNLVVFTLDPVVKPLDYDIDSAGAEYTEKVNERIAKEQAKAKKKAE